MIGHVIVENNMVVSCGAASLDPIKAIVWVICYRDGIDDTAIVSETV